MFIINENNVKVPNPKTSYLYKYGVESDYFIIILDGCATVQVGRNEKERMEITAGLFSYYGVDALLYEHETDPLKCIAKDDERKPYEPEFSLKVNSYCVYLKIYRKDWKEIIRKSIIERTYTPPNLTSSNANSPVSLADTSNGSIIA